MLKNPTAKEAQSTEPEVAEVFSAAGRTDLPAYRHLFDVLNKSIPLAEALVVSSLPRGSLQIVQPGKVSDGLLRAYSRDFHAEDRATWRAITSKAPVRASECWQAGELESSRYFRGIMQPHGFAYLLAVPLTAPVLEGYAGALHLYRTTEHGDFTAAEIEQARQFALELDETIEKSRIARMSAVCQVETAWAHRPPVRQFIFDSSIRLQLPESEFHALDERLREQIIRHARQQMQHLNGSNFTSDRLALPDSRGELWVFRVVIHAKYPALGDGAYIFFCLQPERCDWETIRPADFQADDELSRLVPAMQFMAGEFHRGPTLNDIARTVHLSPFHFHRRFTELMGITPKHFLLECQIDQAKRQLAAGDKELVDIASGCGFAHQSHFTSRFKQAAGLTPTRWRRLVMKLQKSPVNQ